MSEEDRTHVYAWLCEEIGERRAEYVMSCLAPAPLSDLVTKDFLAAQFAAERDRADAQREADQAEAKQRFRWTIGTLIASNGLLVGAVGTIVGLA